MVDPKTTKTKAIFGLSAIPDQLTYQFFSFLIFTFYFTVVQIDIFLIWIAYVIWGIWNAINDPLAGALSDRTNLKWGKRRSYIILTIAPLCLITVLLFTAPIIGDQAFRFAYFMTVIIIFEGIYTLYSVNVNALFPEMFPNESERAKTNLFVKGFTVLALIFSQGIPFLLISDLVPDTQADIPVIYSQYVFSAILIAIIVAIAAIPFIMKGIQEKEELREDFDKRPSFFESLKLTLKNKTFVKFTIANTAIWYIFGLLPAMMPLYAEHVLQVPKGSVFLITIPLMLAFIVAAAVFPLHKKIGEKIGMRNGLILTCAVWIGTLAPYFFMFAHPVMQILLFFVTASQGFSLSGAMYYVDILIGDVIDEDEIKSGVRRSGSFYGINAFIHRISIIFMITSILLVFGNMGWDKTYVAITTPQVIFGLKMLMFILPAIALCIAITFLKWYGLHGKRLEDMRKQVNEQRSKLS